jgi:hypothetical protein
MGELIIVGSCSKEYAILLYNVYKFFFFVGSPMAFKQTKTHTTASYVFIISKGYSTVVSKGYCSKG